MPEVRNLLSITVFSTKVMIGWLWTLRSSALIMDQVTLKNQSDKPSEPGARSSVIQCIHNRPAHTHGLLRERGLEVV
jgi:hypothetical protein